MSLIKQKVKFLSYILSFVVKEFLPDDRHQTTMNKIFLYAMDSSDCSEVFFLAYGEVEKRYGLWRIFLN